MKLAHASIAAAVLLAAGLGWLAIRGQEPRLLPQDASSAARERTLDAPESSALPAITPATARVDEGSQRTNVAPPASVATTPEPWVVVIEVLALNGAG